MACEISDVPIFSCVFIWEQTCDNGRDQTDGMLRFLSEIFVSLLSDLYERLIDNSSTTL